MIKQIIILILAMPTVSFAKDIDCSKAKLSYLLERAAVDNDVYGVRFALELGANPNGVGEKAALICFNGMPTVAPVLSAAKHSEAHVLKLLLEAGASANAWCCDSSALQVAEDFNNKESIILLKKYGAK